MNAEYGKDLDAAGSRPKEEFVMPDYKSIDKTGWFIQKMSSAWLSRKEIVELAASEFPGISEKTLDGTIGQYWSDSVNPKWSTCKTIQARGLRVLESAGRRHLVQAGEYEQPLRLARDHQPRQNIERRQIVEVGEFSQSVLATEDKSYEIGVQKLWNSNDGELWGRALKRYWAFVKPTNLALERELDVLNPELVAVMNAQEWYEFLLDKYFKWKYTAANRYASTTKVLRTYASNNELAVLYGVKDRLFASDKNNIKQCLSIACSIRGLGTAGASGLLAILFPKSFGTVDQFAVKALAQIPELVERSLIASMNPESLNIQDGTVLIGIMRRKAADLNLALGTSTWTPRRVDMVLWTCAR